jgi:hypothetical protein
VYIINTERQADEATLKDYQGMIGSLLYLAVYSRPDILYTVVKLSQFCTNPSTIHLAAVKRIFRYLRSVERLNELFLEGYLGRQRVTAIYIVGGWDCPSSNTPPQNQYSFLP